MNGRKRLQLKVLFRCTSSARGSNSFLRILLVCSMANAVAGGMKSMNVHLDAAGATSSIVIEEYARVVDLRMVELDRDPIFHDVEQSPEKNCVRQMAFRRRRGNYRCTYFHWRWCVRRSAEKLVQNDKIADNFSLVRIPSRTLGEKKQQKLEQIRKCAYTAKANS